VAHVGSSRADAGAAAKRLGLAVEVPSTPGAPTIRERRLVSIVIPARNEEGNIARLEAELNQVLGPLPYDFEFIVIDNHSDDGTGALVKHICRHDSRWRYIRFSRDFSVEMSMAAGYEAARGDSIIVLYSDLQDPPSVIPELLSRWEEGFDVVYGVRTIRPGDAWWRNVAVHLAYRLIGWLSDVPIPVDTGDFRLISRRVRDVLVQLPERNRYTRGLVAWLGFPQTSVPYARRPRESGRSKGSVAVLAVITLNAITSFSTKPPRLFMLCGALSVVGSLAAAAIYLLLSLVGSPPGGVTTIAILLWFMFGFNLLGTGMLGEYVVRSYLEVRARPLFIVEESLHGSDQVGGKVFDARPPSGL
jgi:glycosyltransferase involved in cell wall biosynthesis